MKLSRIDVVGSNGNDGLHYELVGETDLCDYPNCNCPIDFTEECLKGKPITKDELEILTKWTEEAFVDVFYNDGRVK